MDELGPERGQHSDQPNHSPWVAQLERDGPARRLSCDLTTDVVVVGAGIAGVATSFFTLRATDRNVVLVERDRVALGATGHNAGQLTTYFERPLHDIASEFGAQRALQAQAALDAAHDLLDLMAAEAGSTVRVERFVGHMGMFTLDHVRVHLLNNQLRRQGGLSTETVVVSEDAEFLADIPREFDGLYDVVPQSRVCELLDTEGDAYRAVLSDRKGCANSAALTQQVLAHLEATYPDRFRYADRTPVERVVVGGGRAVAHALGRTISARHAVLCTNGFVDHVVEDLLGAEVQLAQDQRVSGLVGYMAAFAEEDRRPPAATSYIRNARVGVGDTPYVYVTRRAYDLASSTVTLTCMGGPEAELDGRPYDPTLPVPGPVLDAMDDEILAFAQPARHRGLPFDFQWHGLMGYSDGLVRVVGRHPEHAELLYNLGCNGVGFLPSVYGGDRIARLLAGQQLPASIFDPRVD